MRTRGRWRLGLTWSNPLVRCAGKEAVEVGPKAPRHGFCKRTLGVVLVLGILGVWGSAAVVWGAPEAPVLPLPALEFGVKPAGSPQDVVLSLQMLALLTVLSMAPAIVLMLTSFTRILVVLSLVRNALGLQQVPPNQVLVTLALFLTFFTMTPVWDKVYGGALVPYMQGDISAGAAWEGTVQPLKAFMLRQTRQEELSLMISLAKDARPRNAQDVSLRALMPAFVLSEIKTAFQMGIVIFVPFIVVDMIVASVLMAMGMIMLPPMMIALPFKILLFVLADGWNLIIASLVTSIR